MSEQIHFKCDHCRYEPPRGLDLAPVPWYIINDQTVCLICKDKLVSTMMYLGKKAGVDRIKHNDDSETLTVTLRLFITKVPQRSES